MFRFKVFLTCKVVSLGDNASMSETIEITANTNAENLPGDTATLRQMILTLLEQIDDLNGQLYYLKRQLYGKRSEKLDPDQRLLDGVT